MPDPPKKPFERSMSPTSSSLEMKAVKTQLGDAIPVFKEILEHMKEQNNHMDTTNARLRLLTKVANRALTLMIVALLLSTCVVLAMVYQTVKQREANDTLKSAMVNLEAARRVNLELKKDLAGATAQMSRLRSEQDQTQQGVERVLENFPKVTVDEKGKLKMEVAVDPEAALKRAARSPKHEAPKTKAAINIQSGRIDF